MPIRIDKFAGMSDKGVFWMENCAVNKVNGQDVITSDYGMREFLNSTNDITGFTPMNSMAPFALGSSAALDLMGIDLAGKMWLFDPVITSNLVGLIHTIAATGSGVNQILKSSHPGILTTANENVLYTSAHHLGIGYKLVVTGASSTSLTVAGTDFTALGISTTDGVNRVFNLTKKKEYVVTSVSGGGNETVNFSATAFDPEVGDEVIAFVDSKFPYNVQSAFSQQFGNQSSPVNWQRQVSLIDDVYYSLNGNFLAKLNADESTFSETFKQLPLNTQATCMATNSSRVLIGAEYRAKGRLLLWDAFSPGWLNILDIEEEPTSVKPYQSGFLVLVGTKLYFTDGYQTKLLTELPDTRLTSSTDGGFDYMEVVNDRVYISNNTYVGNRIRDGVYIYDFASGWTYSALSTLDGDYAYKGTVGGLKTIDTSAGIRIFTSVSIADKSPEDAICYLTDSGVKRYSFMYFIKLSEVVKISTITLDIAPKYNSGQINQASGTEITVNYSDGNNSIFSPNQTTGTPTTTNIPVFNGETYPGVIGQKVIFVDGNMVGKISSYITDIANPGASNESWTISPALSIAPATAKDILMTNLRRCGTEPSVVNPRDIQKSLTDENNLVFSVDEFTSDKILVEVVVDEENSDIDILGITLD